MTEKDRGHGIQKKASEVTWSGILSRLVKEEDGQVLVLTVIIILLAVMFLITIHDVGQLVATRMRMQDIADATAYSGAIMGARAYNFFAYTNRAIVAHAALATQMVIMVSHARMLSWLSQYANLIPYVGPIIARIGPIYETIANRIAGITIPVTKWLNKILFEFGLHYELLAWREVTSALANLPEEMKPLIEIDQLAVEVSGINFLDLVEASSEDATEDKDEMKTMIERTVPRQSGIFGLWFTDWWTWNRSMVPFVHNFWWFGPPTLWLGDEITAKDIWLIPPAVGWAFGSEFDFELPAFMRINQNIAKTEPSIYSVVYLKGENVPAARLLGLAGTEWLPNERIMAVSRAQIVYRNPDKPDEKRNLWNAFWTAKLSEVKKGPYFGPFWKAQRPVLWPPYPEIQH